MAESSVELGAEGAPAGAGGAAGSLGEATEPEPPEGDVIAAVDVLERVIRDRLWDRPEFQTRSRVT